MILRWEIRGEPYGQADYQYDGPADARGHAYFCSICGEIWAKATLDGALFNVWSRKCDRHQDREIYWEFAGSVWMDWERGFQEAMPRRVLEREMELHLAALERRYA